MNANQLISELNNILSGRPWHGNPVMKLIENVNAENAHEKPYGPHSSADILLHMIAWTEETTERLKGKFASNPSRGDWPDPSEYSWPELVSMFNSANEHLKDAIVKMDVNELDAIVNDDREQDLAERIPYKELIRGIIHHHIYHSAQIALLNK